MMPPAFHTNATVAQKDLSLHFVETFLVHLFIYFCYAHPTPSPTSLHSVTAGSCLSVVHFHPFTKR